VDFCYLSELPGPGILEETKLLHCCNGLLLFAVHYNGCYISESYIVCNPATKQCVAVPSSGFTWVQMTFGSVFTYMLFDPGVPCHFNLVQFFVEGSKTSVHVYSSKTQAWSHNKSDWGGYHIAPNSPGVYFNGMLHLLSYLGRDQLTVVDVEGNIQKIIPAPGQVGREIWPLSGYIGQSQGCLYYICHEQLVFSTGWVLERLLIWVLEDYDRQQWVLKDSVSFSKLFGERNCHMNSNYNVVGIHPDHSLVFLVQHWDQKLISYNMDSKEVCDLCTLGHGYKRITDLFTRGHGYKRITPYVPYFSEFGA
jgi:F-box interacting protein